MLSPEGVEALATPAWLHAGFFDAGSPASTRAMIDAVNTAARLCGVAQAGEVIISGSTRGPIEAHVIAETREPVTVKGKSQPLPIWRVTGIHEHAPPREA